MTSDRAARAIAEARAVMHSKRAGLCRHGVAVCHECSRKTTTPAPATPTADVAVPTEETTDA